MSQLSIEQVAQAAWEAGFRDEALVIAVAITHGESSLRPNAVGDESLADGKWGPSIGLFQVRSLHEQTGTGDWRDVEQLADPRFNARAAFEISNGGKNFKPWSVYNHDLHLQFMDQSRAVVEQMEATGAFESGEVFVPGSEPLDFGAGASGDLASTGQLFDAGAARLTESRDRTLETFLESALAQQGDAYVMGHEVRLDDENPDIFDCSELVEWAAAQAGVSITDGSWLQYQAVAKAGTEMSVEEAMRTPGALLFKFGSDPMTPNRPDGAHVAISLGDGRVMEAKGSKYGTEIFNAEGRGWTHAGWIPGIGGDVTPTTLSMEEIPEHQDSDLDGLTDRLEIYIGTDPYAVDTDRDGFADADELLEFTTDPADYMSNPLPPTTTDFQPPLTDGDDGSGVDGPPEPVEPAVPSPGDEAPEVPADETPADEAPEVPADETPTDETPEVPADETPADETPEVPADETPTDETPEVPADEAPEVPVDETPADEAPVAPVDEVEDSPLDELRRRLDEAFGDQTSLLDDDALSIIMRDSGDDYVALVHDYDWLPSTQDSLWDLLGDDFTS